MRKIFNSNSLRNYVRNIKMQSLTPKKSKEYSCKNFHIRVEQVTKDLFLTEDLFNHLSDHCDLLIVGKEIPSKCVDFDVFIVLLSFEGGIRVTFS